MWTNKYLVFEGFKMAQSFIFKNLSAIVERGHNMGKWKFNDKNDYQREKRYQTNLTENEVISP